METKVELKLRGEDKFEVKTHTNDITFYVDKKKENHSSCGPNPLELFLASLASCVGVYAVRYLRNHAVSFKKLAIEARAEFSEVPPSRLINIQVRVTTDAELTDKREVFLRFIRNCSVHNTILHTKDIDIDITS